jgi:hypothetical protein
MRGMGATAEKAPALSFAKLSAVIVSRAHVNTFERYQKIALDRAKTVVARRDTVKQAAEAVLPQIVQDPHDVVPG